MAKPKITPAILGVLLTVSHAGVAAVSETQVDSQPARSPYRQRKPQSQPVSDTEAFTKGIHDDELPEIEARKYPVRPQKKANSGQSYLFDDSSDARPVVGRIILLKDGADNVMAFRVLRTFDVEKQFIAKRVRTYGDHHQLDLGRELTAIERTVETGIPTHSEFTAEEARDQTELMEGMEEGKANPDFFGGAEPQTVPSGKTAPVEESLDALDAGEPTPQPAPSVAPETTPMSKASEPKTHSIDNELDSLDEPGSAVGAASLAELDEQEKVKPLPTPLKEDPELDLADRAPAPSKAQPENDDEDSVVDPNSLLVDDVDPIDLYFHGLSAEFGFLKAPSPTGGSQYFSAAGLRYGLTLGHMLFAKSPHVQDSITLEGGAFHYQVQGYIVNDPTLGTDGFSVTPLIGTLRYTLFFSETTALFFYGGMIKNFAKSTGPDFESNLQGEQLLGGTQTAAGGGLLFRMGPGWEARADFGMDMIAFGMMLRF